MLFFHFFHEEYCCTRMAVVLYIDVHTLHSAFHVFLLSGDLCCTPLVGFVVSSTVGLSRTGDPQRLAHDQHQYHEGGVQGLLVRPDRRVFILVQRRGGEAAYGAANSGKCVVLC